MFYAFAKTYSPFVLPNFYLKGSANFASVKIVLSVSVFIKAIKLAAF